MTVAVLNVLLRQPLHLPLAHRDERLLHGQLAAASPHRRRLAARPGRHDALLRDHGGARRQPDRFGHDADRFPARCLRHFPLTSRTLPIVGAIPYPLVVAAIAWSMFGTGAAGTRRHQAAGARIPQPARRGGLPQGTGLWRGRRQPRRSRRHVAELFANVRKNYFPLYCALRLFQRGRAISTCRRTTSSRRSFSCRPSRSARSRSALFQQIVTAFEQVASSFQYLVNSWPTIVELISIYKRLRAFEATLEGAPLPEIDQRYLERRGDRARPEPADVETRLSRPRWPSAGRRSGGALRAM